jgi:hypothetical protein
LGRSSVVDPVDPFLIDLLDPDPQICYYGTDSVYLGPYYSSKVKEMSSKKGQRNVKQKSSVFYNYCLHTVFDKIFFFSMAIKISM